MDLNKHNFMDRNTELRKLKPAYMGTLVNLLSDCNQMLSNVENWKTLLEVVPKELDVPNSAKRYTSDDISLIEKHSKLYKKEPAEVFLQEWSIAGRNRPKLKHLLDSLVAAKLWRAADYVAGKILKEPLPERPSVGPEARILYPLRTTDLVKIENYLEEGSYPNGLSLNSENQYIDVNLNVPNQIIEQPVKYISKKVSRVSCSENPSTLSNNTNNTISNKTTSSEEQSDTTNTSVESNQTASTYLSNSSQSSAVATSLPHQLPNLTLLINCQQAVQHSNQNVSSENSEIPRSSSSKNNELLNLPAIATLLSETNVLLPNIQDLSNPKITQEISNNQNQELPPIFDLLSNSNNLSNSLNRENLPISQFEPTSSALPSNNHNSSEIRPLISHLLSNKSSEIIPDNSQNVNGFTLPKLELNTTLPHFEYSKLELHTNNFNNDKFNLDHNNSGRYLGSGGFGSVYLAVGLNQNELNYVAVKRIKLDGNLPIARIAKLFKNEVEILSKYQHKNLVSLLGYSCDGPTYCLLYEYVSGSSLATKLLSTSSILSWKERIQISHGISVGISYLHTAYASPLIHRDVKSENILLTEDNTPKLCDFGLVKSTPDTKTNFTSVVSGTQPYMAPESFRGDVSIKMDTFSFGVVLFELLTSLPSFVKNREEGADMITYIESKSAKEIDDLFDSRAGTWLYDNVYYSQKIFELANLCVTDDKKIRPTMVEVRDQLKKFVDHISNTV